MHKKKVVILRILEVRLQRYGLWKLFGGKMVFLGGFLGFFFLNFGSGWMVLAQKIGLLRSVRIFLGIFG
jgi:hypothetical protein